MLFLFRPYNKITPSLPIKFCKHIINLIIIFIIIIFLQIVIIIIFIIIFFFN